MMAAASPAEKPHDVQVLLAPKVDDAGTQTAPPPVPPPEGATPTAENTPTTPKDEAEQRAKTGGTDTDGESKPQKRRKSRKSSAPISAKEARLRKAMKPLTEKCIPDKAPKIAIDNKYAAPPRVAPRKNIAKENVYRRSSKLALTMPRVREPEEIMALKTEKMVHKLIKYMKKSWKVKVDPKQSEREPIFRTIQSVYTRKPDKWEDLIARRERTAIETGFFCGFDANYASLINLELDTPMLVFNNLPPDLKITAARWLKQKANKEALKQKRDAYLPKLPNSRFQRPNFARGKLVKDPGGLKAVDEFVKVSERFQQLCKGSKYFAKVLADWSQKKEDENENVNYGFGTVPADFRYGFTANRPEEEEEEEDEVVVKESEATTVMTDGEGDEEEEKEQQKRYSSERRESIVVDSRKYLREAVQMEHMITALYFIIKSILNIKIKQIYANLPMPYEVVMHLREHSPEPNKLTEKKSVAVPEKQKITKRTRKVKTPPLPAGNIPSVAKPVSPEGRNKSKAEEADEYSDDEACMDLENAMKAQQHHVHTNTRLTIAASLMRDPLHIHPSDILDSSPIHSSHKVIAEVKRVFSLQEKMLMKNEEMSVVQKLKSLIEPPNHAAQRLARNAATYSRLFQRHQKQKKPIWQDVQVDQYIVKYAEKDRNVLTKDPTNLTEADAEEMVEMAIRKREMLPSSKRWPDADAIPTPTFPFIHTPRRIGSEEQSRRNLLASMPRKDDIPPTPVRRLFKLAGVRTTEKQTFNAIYDMKRAFRATEKKFRVFCGNEILKMEFDTMRRYKAKLNAIYPDPVYQWTIAMMRQATKMSKEEEEDEQFQRNENMGGVRRQALWFRKLMEECNLMGVVRHSGCQLAIEKLMKFCDIDIKSKQNLLSRLALLVVSLPTTELGTRHWQSAILFLLENFFGVPKEVLMEWLAYRNLPMLIT